VSTGAAGERIESSPAIAAVYIRPSHGPMPAPCRAKSPGKEVIQGHSAQNLPLRYPPVRRRIYDARAANGTAGSSTSESHREASEARTVEAVMMRSGIGRTLALFCVAEVLAVHLTSCGPSGAPRLTIPTGPTTPTPSPPTARIDVSCPTSLLVGESSACSASFIGATGQIEFITFTAAWSATPTEVLAIGEYSRITGRAAGTATVNVSYGGTSATANVVVKAEDGLVLTIATTQSSGRAGELATIDFFGYYSVVSADSGTIELVIRAADGRHISTARRDVTRGGGQFLLQNHFLLPPGAGRACGEASLLIAGRSVEPTGPVANTPVCVTVTG
jgi:hypothetical protein